MGRSDHDHLLDFHSLFLAPLTLINYHEPNGSFVCYWSVHCECVLVQNDSPKCQRVSVRGLCDIKTFEGFVY